jgi:hypothetical protein
MPKFQFATKFEFVEVEQIPCFAMNRHFFLDVLAFAMIAIEWGHEFMMKSGFTFATELKRFTIHGLAGLTCESLLVPSRTIFVAFEVDFRHPCRNLRRTQNHSSWQWFHTQSLTEKC